MEWKLEHIIMDSVMGLPHTCRSVDNIWVIIGLLTKSTQSLPIEPLFNTERLAAIHIQEVFFLDGTLNLLSHFGVLSLLLDLANLLG